MTLSRRSMVTISIPTAIIFAISLAIVSSVSKRYAMERTKESLLIEVRNKTLEIQRDLNTPFEMLSAMGLVFRTGFFSYYGDTENVFQNFSSNYPGQTGFYGSDTFGKVYKGTSWETPDGWNPLGREWYKGAVASKGELYISSVYTDPLTKNATVTISKSVHFPNGDLSGVIAFDYQMDNTKKLMLSKKTFQNEKSFLLSGNGNFIIHEKYLPEDNLASVENGIYRDLAQKLLTDSEDFILTTINGKGYYFKSMEVGIADWRCVLGLPVEDVTAFSRTMSRMLFLSFLTLFIIIMVSTTLIIRSIIRPLTSTADALTEIASGNADLSKRLTIKAHDEIGLVVKNFNRFVENLQTIMSGIKKSETVLTGVASDMEESTHDTSQSINDIITNLRSISDQINSQVSGVEETSSVVREVSENITSLGNMIELQSSSVAEASSAVEQMIGNIGSVNTSVDKMADSFNELDQRAQDGINKQQAVNIRIEQIESQSEMLQDANSAIAAIAEQTNLLAMNAAIEAAHAGEAGKGFSVVADEIRKLSETSTVQSKTIGDELKKIKDTISEIVATSTQSSEAFSAVSAKIRETDELVRQIKSAMDEQNAGSKQIIESLHSMGSNTLNVKSASAKMAEGNRQILDEMEHLQSDATLMKDSMDIMSDSARKITMNGEKLGTISGRMRESISGISIEIDKFNI